ncbi:MAG: 6-phosphogluconolactonase, partial [Chloroflexota bacterium]|nr:6-phosphogluconolactonase [Chloroflexota bacterium]
LIDRVPIPEVNVHHMQGELSPEEGALVYEQLLYRYFSWKTPVFDLVLLGMGEDGHTASLFPGDRSLRERKRWVIAIDHNQPPVPAVPRLTLTLPILNFARKVIFLVAGESKAETVRRILVSGGKLPAGMVKPVSGNLKWMLDKAAGTEVG